MIRLFDVLPSTNDFCLANAADLKHGSMIVARRQTAGRGRRGRIWSSARKGDFYGSLLLRPPENFDLTTLPILTAVAVCEQVQKCGVQEAWIKWPNDIWIGGRKLGGLLIESNAARPPAVVIGIGVNLAATESDLAGIDQPATSIVQESGACPKVDDFAAELRKTLLEKYRGVCNGDRQTVLQSWRRNSRLQGRRVKLHLPDGKDVSGIVKDLADDGGLTLMMPDGKHQTFLAGDLSIA